MFPVAVGATFGDKGWGDTQVSRVVSSASTRPVDRHNECLFAVVSAKHLKHHTAHLGRRRHPGYVRDGKLRDAACYCHYVSMHLNLLLHRSAAIRYGWLQDMLLSCRTETVLREPRTNGKHLRRMCDGWSGILIAPDENDMPL